MCGAALCWSIGGVVVRLLELDDPWEIVFWRSAFMVAFIASVMLRRGWAQARAQIVAVGSSGVVAGLLLASTFFFFILSLSKTTAANTFILMSVSPMFAAVFGRWFLGERVPLRTAISIGVALLGILVMFMEGADGGHLVGNLLALGVPLAYSLNLIIVRKHGGRIDMLPTVLLAGVFSMLLALPLAWPMTAQRLDLAGLATMGIIQLGVGCLLMMRAARHLNAAEIGLLGLIETTLGPLWVWLIVHERPGSHALIGGGLVLGALLANEAVGLLMSRKVLARAGP